MARVARLLGENVPPELVFPRSTALLRTSADSDSDSDSDSETAVEDKSRLSLEELRFGKVALEPLEERIPLQTVPSTFTPSGGLSSPRQSTSSDRAWFPSSLRRSLSHKRHSRAPVVMRTEAGWIGEWNQDENTVVRSLRELRSE
jgi:hypothetical protein